MSNKIIIVGVLCALIFGAGGFYGGMKYQQGKSPAAASGNFQRGAANISGALRNGRTGGGGNGFATGEILSKDDKSVTIQLRSPQNATGTAGTQAGSKIIFFSASTEITKSASGTPADLQVGQTITVSGTANADGSVSAQSIQLRPTPANQPAPVNQ